MSQRGNGMMAHMDRPGKLTDALDHIMLGKDPASLFQRPRLYPKLWEFRQKHLLSRPIRRLQLRSLSGRTKTEQGKAADGVFGELTSHERYQRKVVTLNTRIDDWVAEAVEATRRQIEDHLKKKDPNMKVGKQDVVNQALIRGAESDASRGMGAFINRCAPSVRYPAQRVGP